MPRNSQNTSSTVYVCLQLLAQLNTASTSAFHFLVDFFTLASAFPFPDCTILRSICRHLNAAFQRISLSHFARLQFIAHFNQIITSFILTLLTFMQLKYQGINDPTKSPFATHPMEMTVAVATSAVHYLAYTVALRFPVHRFDFLAEHLLVTSGSIAVASLLCVMLPDRAAPFVYAIFGLLSAAEFLSWLLRKLIVVKIEAEFWIQRWGFRRFWINMFGKEEDSYDQWMMRMRLQV